ncbi:MAG TPA: threonine/serine dehydratase [Actinomycetota bacterium]|nr:threonine/serine dehydratase [Actinomycetota bacterium]
MPSDDLLRAARLADERLRPHVRETPLHASSWLGRDRGTTVLLKLENLQVTGSFKFRGALNTILTLPEETRSRGVVTASTGNHGAAVAHAASLVGVPAHVFVHDPAPAPKLARILGAGATVSSVAGDPLNAEIEASAYARDHDLPYISPYNDAAVVAGQATVGLEIARQCSVPPEAVFVPLGGGGLASGVALGVKSTLPSTRIVGCSPEHSPAMARAVEAGRILEVPSEPTLSDGTAGGIEPGSITFDLCRSLVDEFLLVSEEDIARGLRQVILKEGLLVEGAAAVGAAAYQRVADRYDASGSVVVILSGANIARETLLEVLSGG